MRFTINLDGSGVDEMQKAVLDYKKDIERKATQLVEKLAQAGYQVAKAGFESAEYDGERGSDEVKIENRGGKTRAVVAIGETVLFVEFGTGVVYPDNHPEAAKNGMVRGGYGKGHGSQKTWGFYGEELGSNGKYATKKDGSEKIPHVVLTHGNPANMPMYNAVKALEKDFKQMVREVFGE